MIQIQAHFLSKLSKVYIFVLWSSRQNFEAFFSLVLPVWLYQLISTLFAIIIKSKTHFNDVLSIIIQFSNCTQKDPIHFLIWNSNHDYRMQNFEKSLLCTQLISFFLVYSFSFFLSLSTHILSFPTYNSAIKDKKMHLNVLNTISRGNENKILQMKVKSGCLAIRIHLI